MRSLGFAALIYLILGSSSLAKDLSSEVDFNDPEVISPQIVPFTNAGMDRLPPPAPSRYQNANITPFQNSNIQNPPYPNPLPNQAPLNTQPYNDASVSQLEYYMYGLINQDRSRFGAPPVKLDIGLCNFARNYAQRMLRESFFGHVDPQGRDFQTRANQGGIFCLAHENIGWQSRNKRSFDIQLVELVEAEMMAEPPNQINHRYAILLPANQYVGVGIVHSNKKLMVVQEFTESEPFSRNFQ